MRNIRNNKGFTLIELMIVVVIIGILAAIAIPKFSNVGNQAKQKEADGVLKQIVTLQETFQVRFGSYAPNIAPAVAGDGNDLLEVGYEQPALQHFNNPILPAAPTANGFTVQMTPLAAEQSLVCRQIVVDNTAANPADRVTLSNC